MKAPKEVISIREEVDKLKTNTMEMMQKMNRLERELR
jgi:ubiquinone biosynthesis protein UbiJ